MLSEWIAEGTVGGGMDQGSLGLCEARLGMVGECLLGVGHAVVVGCIVAVFIITDIQNYVVTILLAFIK